MFDIRKSSFDSIKIKTVSCIGFEHDYTFSLSFSPHETEFLAISKFVALLPDIEKKVTLYFQYRNKIRNGAGVNQSESKIYAALSKIGVLAKGAYKSIDDHFETVLVTASGSADCINESFRYFNKKDLEEMKSAQTKAGGLELFPYINIVSIEELGAIYLKYNCRTSIFYFKIAKDSSFNIALYSNLAEVTAGKLLVFPINEQEFKTENQKMANCQSYSNSLEKLHYDLNQIIMRLDNCFFNASIKIRPSKDLIYEMIGIKQPLIPIATNEFNKQIILKYKEGYTNKQNRDIHFVQSAVLYSKYAYDSGSWNKTTIIRILNCVITSVKDYEEVYSTFDNDCAFKLSAAQSLSAFRLNGYNDNTFKVVKKAINDRIFESVLNYRNKCNPRITGTLLLSFSYKYYILYWQSLIKRIKPKNVFVYDEEEKLALIFELLYLNLQRTIKRVYPKLYRLDDVEKDIITRSSNSEFCLRNIGYIRKFNNQTNSKEMIKFTILPKSLPLSYDSLRFNGAYLLDNGSYLTAYLFKQVDEYFIQTVSNKFYF